MIPAIRPSAFTENLQPHEWLAIDARGNVLSRAAGEDAARRAAPDAAHVVPAVDPTLAAGAATPSADPVLANDSTAAALERIRREAAPSAGPEPAAAALGDVAVEVLGEPPAAEAVVEGQPVAEKVTKNTTKQQVADGSKFDHDGDGKVGGAPAGGNKKKPK